MYFSPKNGRKEDAVIAYISTYIAYCAFSQRQTANFRKQIYFIKSTCVGNFILYVITPIRQIKIYSNTLAFKTKKNIIIHIKRAPHSDQQHYNDHGNRRLTARYSL